jgi:hypothetical protein
VLHSIDLYNVLCRFFFEIKRRADAVKNLPGPEYGFLGIMDVVKNKNCHRWATAMADKYGAIFKCRIFHYHVSPTKSRLSLVAFL